MKPLVVTLLLVLLGFAAQSQQAGATLLSPAQIKKDSLRFEQLFKQSTSLKYNNKAQGMTLAKKALAIAQHAGSAALQSKSYLLLGWLVREQRPHELFIYDSLALTFGRASGDSVLLVNALYRYATDLTNNNHLKAAWPYLTEVDSIANLLTVKTWAIDVAVAKGLWYNKQFRTKEASAAFDKSLQLAESIHDEHRIAVSKVWIVTNNAASFQTGVNTQFVFDAIDYYKKVDNHRGIADAYDALGSAFQNSGNIPKAIAYYQLSVSHYQRANRPIAAANNELVIALLLTSQRKTDSAQMYLKKASAYFKSIKYEQGVAYADVYWARYYTAIGEPEKVRPHLEASVAYNKKLKSPTFEMATTFSASDNEARSGDYKAADSLLNEGMVQMRKSVPAEYSKGIGKMLKANDPDIDTADASYTDRFMQGNEKPAFRFDTADFRKDPILGVDTSTNKLRYIVSDAKLLELETRYRTKEFQDSLQLSNQQITIARQEIVNRNLSLGAAAVVLALLAIVLWQQRKRRLQADVARQRAEEDKAKISKLKEDLAHRTANYLQSVSAFVSLTKPVGNNDSFNELASRLKAMQTLYSALEQGAEDQAMHMEEYLMPVCHNLLHLFEAGRKVSITVHAPVQMSSKAAFKVALIVNELLTNSLKYAFEGRSSGNIRIGLRQNEEAYHLTVRDDGVGMPATAQRSIGMELIEGFCHELGGSCSFREDSGTHFMLTFPATNPTAVYA